MNKRVLVTGAGFIGSHVAEHFLLGDKLTVSIAEGTSRFREWYRDSVLSRA